MGSALRELVTGQALPVKRSIQRLSVAPMHDRVRQPCHCVLLWDDLNIKSQLARSTRRDWANAGSNCIFAKTIQFVIGKR